MISQLAARVPVEIPLTPDPDTAREWLEDELAKPRYQSGASLFDRIAQWLSDLLENLFTTEGVGAIPNVGYIIGAVILAILIILGIRFWAPALRQGRKRKDAALFDDDFRSANDIAAAAAAAAKAGDFSLALVERYRAIVRRCEERVIIDDRAGRTALEAARDIGRPLPALAVELVEAAQTFGAVLYGHREASREDYEAMTALAERVGAAQPVLEAAP